MATPEHIVALRRLIGDALLWLPGVTAVVVRDDPEASTRPDGPDVPRQVLLVQRADNGAWTPVTGIVDPGEEPHLAAVREVLEETCVVAEVERLAWVKTTEPIRYVNGDQAQYLDHTFLCRYLGGEAAVGDDESLDVRWWPLDDLPPMRPIYRERIEAALSGEERTRLG